MYEWLEGVLRLPLTTNPDLLLQTETGIRAAVAIFALNKKCNRLADGLNGRGDYADLKQYEKITRRINGGTNGRVDRERRYLVALRVLDDKQFEDARLEQTISALTISASPAPAPIETSAPMASTPPPTQVDYTSTLETSLLDELPLTAQTKTVGGPILRRLGVRVGGSIVALWLSGIAGRIFLILVAAAIVVFVYRERKAVSESVRKLIRKLKEAQ